MENRSLVWYPVMFHLGLMLGIFLFYNTELENITQKELIEVTNIDRSNTAVGVFADIILEDNRVTRKEYNLLMSLQQKVYMKEEPSSIEVK